MKHNMLRGPVLGATALIGLALIDPIAHAQPGAAPDLGAADVNDFSVRLGGGHSDNIFREETGQISSNYRALGFLVDYSRDGSRADIDVTGDIEYREYSADGLDNEPYGALDTAIVIDALPNRIRWIIDDSYGQGRTDPFRVDDPTNREQINVFNTGPEFDLPLGERTSLRMSHLVGQQSFEDSSRLDSDTATSVLALTRAVNSTTNWGPVIELRDTDYEIGLFDNEIYDAYIRYEKRLSSGSATLSFGTSRVEFDTSDDSTPYLSLTWERDLATRSRLRFALANGFVDAAETFRFADVDSLSTDRIDDVLLSADVYEQTSAGLSYIMTFARSSVTLGASMLEDEYQNGVALNNEQRQLDLDWTRTISPLMEVGVTATTAERDFAEIARSDEDRAMILWLSRTFGARMGLEFSLEHSSRTGTTDIDNDETLFSVYLRYDVRRQF